MPVSFLEWLNYRAVFGSRRQREEQRRQAELELRRREVEALERLVALSEKVLP